MIANYTIVNSISQIKKMSNGFMYLKGFDRMPLSFILKFIY